MPFTSFLAIVFVIAWGCSYFFGTGHIAKILVGLMCLLIVIGVIVEITFGVTI